MRADATAFSPNELQPSDVTPTLFVLTHYFHVWDKAAVMIGICLGALANYFVCNYVIFRDKSPAATPP